MTDNQNFYIIEHGVRLRGMPGWKTTLKGSEIWRVTTFLSNIDKLPPHVQAAWKDASTQPESPASADPGAKNSPKE